MVLKVSFKLLQSLHKSSSSYSNESAYPSSIALTSVGFLVSCFFGVLDLDGFDAPSSFLSESAGSENYEPDFGVISFFT